MELCTTCTSTAAKRAAIWPRKSVGVAPALFSSAPGSAKGQRIAFNELRIRAFNRRPKQRTTMGKLRAGMSPLSQIVAAAGAVGALAVAAPLTLAPTAAAAAAAAPFDSEIADFYRARGGAPLWFSPTSGNAAPQLIQLLASAQADHLNPRRYNVRALTRALQDASSGNPAAIQRAEVLFSQAFVTYARDLKHDPGIGVIYVDPELKPTPPSPLELLTAAAHAPSLSEGARPAAVSSARGDSGAGLSSEST
jgi:murein L,D-transpeptidase YcbB/YkuD